MFKQAGVTPIALAGDTEVNCLVLDSRKLSPGRPGCVFVCMPGTSTDSHAYLASAKANGASGAIVYSRDGFEEAVRLGLPAAQLSQHRAHFADQIWRLCDAAYNHPTRQMKVIGVTGTNGKTTTAWLVRDMLAALGVSAGYLGTLGFHLPTERGVEERELNNTTPFSVELYGLLNEARQHGVQALAMEVSSHALKEQRVDGIEFDAAVFTNLTQDHLDFHGTMADYEASKRRLFDAFPVQTSPKTMRSAINLDDATGAKWAAEMADRHPVTFSQSRKDATLWASDVSVRVDGQSMRLNDTTGAQIEVAVRLGGSYNTENLLSAVAGMVALGYRLEDLKQAIESVRPVPGRFEAVPNDAGIGILVDYAHTPDAIEKLLDAVRPLTTGRVISVFGCGGDRDKTKRPKMARAASLRSDLTVATSDNPRTEDPEAILRDVVAGIEPGVEHLAIVDRGEAVAAAIKAAKPGDVVVIAGKGHENYQIIGRTKYPMDDRDLAKKGLEARAS